MDENIGEMEGNMNQDKNKLNEEKNQSEKINNHDDWQKANKTIKIISSEQPFPYEYEGTPKLSFKEWLYQNNPFYLLSILLMFVGMYMVIQASSAGTSTNINVILSFFAIQNVYELIMLGMCLFLFVKGVNNRHGKILLLFILLFMGDVTFYQVRITGATSSLGLHKTGLISSSIYFILTILKIALIVYYLKIKFHIERLIYPVLAFSVIYFSPHILYYIVDNAGTAGEKSAAVNYLWWEIYLMWLFAALIQLPLIVRNWVNNTLTEVKENKYFENENNFYALLLFIPFIIVPIQLVLNIHPDAQAANPRLTDLTYCIIPYFISGVFFVQTFFKSYIEDFFSTNQYDFFTMCLILFLAWNTQVDNAVFGNDYFTPNRINTFLIILAHTVLVLTRKNKLSLLLLLAVGGHSVYTTLNTSFRKVYKYTTEISMLTWAIIMMSSSFVFLITGFVYSIKGQSEENTELAAQ